MNPMITSAAGQDAPRINRRLYDALWADTYLIQPQRFNTWPLVYELNAACPRHLEIGPGLRPRLPLADTHFIEISRAALSRLVQHGGIVAQARF